MLLKLIAGLHDRENRFEAATQLAAWFDCLYLMVFTIDPEINVLLPAPGFPQTLPDGKAWKDFSELLQRKEVHYGSLPFPHHGNMLSATGISGPENSAVILLGGTPSEKKLDSLKDILPLLVTFFKQEQVSMTSETRVFLAEKSAAKAEKLTKTIDQMRLHLKEALVKQETDKRAIENLMNKKDEFMNVASHELKTPITSMKAYLQILSRLIPPGENILADNIIHKANIQVTNLTELISDLLDVSKIQAGQMIYQFEDVEISEIIEDVVSQIQLSGSTHRIIIASNTRAMVHGERQRLEQVLHNFLSNAIKYSPDADKVIVNSQIAGNQIKVRVKDYGIGISEEMRPFVFDRFFRVQQSSRQFSGLGLGLFISAEIIKRHNGQVGVISDARGSEFFFELPIIEAGLPAENL